MGEGKGKRVRKKKKEKKKGKGKEERKKKKMNKIEMKFSSLIFPTSRNISKTFRVLL